MGHEASARKEWSTDEDRYILEAVETFGRRQWRVIASQMTNRSEDAIRNRYKRLMVIRKDETDGRSVEANGDQEAEYGDAVAILSLCGYDDVEGDFRQTIVRVHDEFYTPVNFGLPPHMPPLLGSREGAPPSPPLGAIEWHEREDMRGGDSWRACDDVTLHSHGCDPFSCVAM